MKVTADSGDTGVASKPCRLQRPFRTDQAGEATGAFYLHPVVEDLDPDVVAGRAIGAMDDGVNKCLQPSIFGDQSSDLEAPALTKRPPRRL